MTGAEARAQGAGSDSIVRRPIKEKTGIGASTTRPTPVNLGLTNGSGRLPTCLAKPVRQGGTWSISKAAQLRSITSVCFKGNYGQSSISMEPGPTFGPWQYRCRGLRMRGPDYNRRRDRRKWVGGRRIGHVAPRSTSRARKLCSRQDRKKLEAAGVGGTGSPAHRCDGFDAALQDALARSADHGATSLYVDGWGEADAPRVGRPFWRFRRQVACNEGDWTMMGHQRACARSGVVRLVGRCQGPRVGLPPGHRAGKLYWGLPAAWAPVFGHRHQSQVGFRSHAPDHRGTGLVAGWIKRRR